MTDNPDLWEVRTLPGGLALELQAGDDWALVLPQGENRVGVELTDAQALTSGQYVRCVICGRWVGPSDLHRLTIEDAVSCWPCGDVGLLTENLAGETVFTYADADKVEGRNKMSDNNEAWIAQRYEHCMDCYRMFVPYIPYHCR